MAKAYGIQIAAIDSNTAVAKRGVAEVRVEFPGAAEVLERVAELADSVPDDSAMVESFPPSIRPEVQMLITGLRTRGMLDRTTGDPVGDFWSTVGSVAPAARQRLGEASALVIGDGPLAASLAAALGACGVGDVVATNTASNMHNFDICCAAAEDAGDQGLASVAEQAFAAGAVFLPTWIDDLVIRVGPMTHPIDTACLRCYLLRVDSNDAEREVHRLLRRHSSSDVSSAGFLPPMATVAGQVAGMEAVKYLSGLPVTTTGHIIEMSLVPFKCEVRRVLRVPRCPVCSRVARQSAPIVTDEPQLSE